jgi:CDP-4-dehydro-6-deoxyglucose reductase, E1
MVYSLASSTWDKQEIEIATRLLEAGSLTMGPEVLEFEKQFAKFIGTKYAVMFNSGSSANLGIFVGLKYMKNSPLKDGDHVIVPAVSWSTTYYPVNQSGFVLDFVDIDCETLNIDLECVKAAITSKTKAIFAVNLLGNPAQLIELKEIADEFGLILIEDNCESLGAKINHRMTGSIGMASSHSFFFSHHICTMEGGMVTTNSLELAETMMSIRAHGWTRGLPKQNSVFDKSDNPWDDLFRFVLPGYNLRPLEISGAIGQAQLAKFPKFLEIRRKNARKFVQLCSQLKSLQIQKEMGESSWFGFSLILTGKLKGKRSSLIRILEENEIDSRPIVAGNFTLNPVMKHLSYVALRKFENANLIHDDGLFIGNHHFDISSELDRIYLILSNFEKENCL